MNSGVNSEERERETGEREEIGEERRIGESART